LTNNCEHNFYNCKLSWCWNQWGFFISSVTYLTAIYIMYRKRKRKSVQSV